MPAIFPFCSRLPEWQAERGEGCPGYQEGDKDPRRPMHICFLSIDTHSAERGGGIASYIEAVAPELVEAGHRVTVISIGRKRSQSRQGELRHLVVRPPALHWYMQKAAPGLGSLAALVRELEWSFSLWSTAAAVDRRDPIDLIEACETAIGWRWGRARHIPYLVRGHGSGHTCAIANGVRLGIGDHLVRRMQVRAIRSAAAISAVSEFQRAELAQETGVAAQKIAVIANPLCPSYLEQPAPTSSAADQRSPKLILYTGRNEIRKGTGILLQTAPLVQAVDPEVRFVLAGGNHSSIAPQALETMQRKADGGAGVELLGHLRRDELPGLYRQASIFVMPSLYETFGISVVEAMGFRLPVVASRVGGLSEVVVDGVTGLLVPPADPAALAEALLRLLDDDELCRRMGEAGYRRVRSLYSLEQLRPQLLKFYQSILAGV